MQSTNLEMNWDLFDRIGTTRCTTLGRHIFKLFQQLSIITVNVPNLKTNNINSIRCMWLKFPTNSFA